jgi:hypothetical protein
MKAVVAVRRKFLIVMYALAIFCRRVGVSGRSTGEGLVVFFAKMITLASELYRFE